MATPGLKFLPELQEFRLKMQDFHHVVSAYEDHEHVYTRLRTRPGTVLIRGGGIVASRVLQRLMDDRAAYGLQTRFVHLFRTYVTGSHGKNAWNRRRGGDGFAYQGFNYPKSVWGGQLKHRMRTLEGEQRATAYDEMDGTNTPRRRSWQAAMSNGRAQGWYRPLQGTVTAMSTGLDGRILSAVHTEQGGGGHLDVPADFVVLARTALFGVAWECLYHLLMQWRWEKDWPTFFGFATFLNEGVLVYLLVRTGTLPGIAGRGTLPHVVLVPFWFFWIDFLAVWMTVWLWANGPMRVVDVRWRFFGGRIV